LINFQELKYHAYLYLLIHNLNGKLFGLLKIYKELFCLQKKHYQSNLFQTHTIHPLNQLVLKFRPHDFYRELFPAGSLQQEPEDGKGNIIATQIRPSGRGRTRQWVIDDSLKMLDKVIGDRFGLIPPISFYGKSHTKENAHELFAVVVDVDYVGKQQLKNLLKQFGNGVQLRPTYLVSSGKGVHLYYFLQEQVQLYRNREEVLAELKEALIRRLWNDTSSIRPDSPDITGIYQGFRCVGSQSKLGADFPVKAYKLSENRYTLEDIKASIPSCKVSPLQHKGFFLPISRLPLIPSFISPFGVFCHSLFTPHSLSP
jgi:hypothetical protein